MSKPIVFFFRDLAVYLYYFKDEKTKAVSNWQYELREINMGMPGLVLDSVTGMLSLANTWLVFDLDFTMEFRIGSYEREGFSVPLPFPTNQCNIQGTFDTRTGSHQQRFINY